MIELPRPSQTSSAELRIKIVGLGDAGSHALDRLQLENITGTNLLVINTDAQSLMGSQVAERLQIGSGVTRGLGAGGDPELGYEAARESADALRASLSDCDVLLLSVGLGGGTGSGAAPLIASYARAHGSFVVVFATMPFSFEGSRRTGQAAETLVQLLEQADVVLCFENDRMGEAVSPGAPVHEAFAAADEILTQSVSAVATLVRRRGIVHLGLDSLAAALRRESPRCLFGFGEADGNNRTHLALERALSSPLMDRGRMLADAQSVLVSVAGGTGLTLHELQTLMTELNRHINDRTRILFGAAIDPHLGERITVTILSSLEAGTPAQEVAVREEEPAEILAEPVIGELPVRAAPAVTVRATLRPTATEAVAAKREARQEQVQFDAVTRGRFEKSEPTIVDGQDLDVPTFLRRGVTRK